MKWTHTGNAPSWTKTTSRFVDQRLLDDPHKNRPRATIDSVAATQILFTSASSRANSTGGAQVFESLRSLSDSQIITGSKVARAQEHSGLLAMIGFIAETDRRQLFLRRGYSSLYDYCVRELGYSESQAMRRITTARCIEKFPDVFEFLKANEINLATISRVSKILTAENCGEVLESIRRKSLREVEAIVAEHEPVAAFPRDRVRTIVAKIPASQVGEIYLRSEGKKHPTFLESPTDDTNQEAPASTIEQMTQPDRTDPPRDRSSATEPAAKFHDQSQERPPASTPPARFERRARVEFTARQELMEKLERIRAIASHRIPARASMEQLIDFMADYVIHREDPLKRHQRRQARHSKKNKALDD